MNAKKSIHERAREETQKLQDKMIVEMMMHAGFDGWSKRALAAAEESSGLGKGAAYRAFPNGLKDAAAHASDYFDRQMLARLDGLDLDSMKIRERVIAGVRTRIEACMPYKEGCRRLMGYLALPGNKPMAGRAAWATCNKIWYAAGDNATDFNYYTKRGLLFPVYTTTVLYWLSDTSENAENTWGYLERRIADVMKIPGYQAKARKALERLPNPLKVMRRASRT